MSRRLSTRRKRKRGHDSSTVFLAPSECLLHQQRSEPPFISTVSFSKVTFFAHFIAPISLETEVIWGLCTMKGVSQPPAAIRPLCSSVGKRPHAAYCWWWVVLPTVMVRVGDTTPLKHIVLLLQDT